MGAVGGVAGVFNEGRQADVECDGAGPATVVFYRNKRASNGFSVFQHGLGDIQRGVGVGPFRLLRVNLYVVVQVQRVVRERVSVLLANYHLREFVPPFGEEGSVCQGEDVFRFSILVFARIRGLVSRTRRGVCIALGRRRRPILISNRHSIYRWLFREVDGRDRENARVVESVHGRGRFNVDHFFRLVQRLGRLIALFLRFVPLFFRLLLLF